MYFCTKSNENLENVTSVTAQLAEIRKVTLGKVICDNSDNIEVIQPYVLQLPFRQAYPTDK